MKLPNYEYTYGGWHKYGWGVLKHDDNLNDLDFDPEFEYRQDVKDFWRRRSILLSLPEMTYVKYFKLLFKGLRQYRRMR